MERGEYNHVDLMVGMTTGEGLLQTVQFILHPELYLYAKLKWDRLAPMFLFGRSDNQLLKCLNFVLIEVFGQSWII